MPYLHKAERGMGMTHITKVFPPSRGERLWYANCSCKWFTEVSYSRETIENEAKAHRESMWNRDATGPGANGCPGK